MSRFEIDGQSRVGQTSTPKLQDDGVALQQDDSSLTRAVLQRKIQRRMVQRHRGEGSPHEAQIQSAAAEGIQGSGGSLPHLGAIQKSFGRHDVSGIQAHTDDKAQAASQKMGAEAFATGNHVAFAGAPSLHTAAHEAAHVVQQRGGVQLQGGVGKEGDSYEQHADRVADAVVRGESAEHLLDTHAGAGAAVQRSAGSGAAASPGAVQRMKKETPKGSGTFTDVDLAALSESDVLMKLADMEGVPGAVGQPARSDTLYETGDKAALEARRDTAGFGATSKASLLGMINTPTPEFVAAAAARKIDPAVAADFQRLFVAIRDSPRVVGFGVWAASKIPVCESRNPVDAGKHLLNAINELREVERQLVALPAAQTIDLRECVIGGTAQTADLTASGGKQIEVKTVDRPITDFSDLQGELAAGLKKFEKANPLGGPYEVVVFGSYDPAIPSVTSNAKGKQGSTDTTFDRAAGTRTQSFTPAPPNMAPARTATDSLAAWGIRYLNSPGAGKNVAHRVTIRLENTPDAPGEQTFSRGAGGWVTP